MLIKHFLIVGMAGVALTGNTALVNLSAYTDLTDRHDDSQAFAQAVKDAGDGGMVYIPAGTVVLKSPVQIENQSVSIVGDGLSVTRIESAFSTGEPAISFIAPQDRRTPCRWALRDMLLNAGTANIGAALELKDERGVIGDSRMKISNVLFISSVQHWFERGIVIDGMARVDIETANFVGELRDNPEEKKGRLTRSHIELTGLPSGDISLFLCHLRMAENQFELRADFERLYLRQLNMVQCGNCINYDRPGRRGEWLYLHGCASQLENPLSVHGIDGATISSSRFILKANGRKSKTMPCIEMDSVSASMVSGNFLHNNGIHYKNNLNGVVFGNHAYEGGGEIQLEACRNFALCNNYSQGGNNNAAATVTGSGKSENIMLSESQEER